MNEIQAADFTSQPQQMQASVQRTSQTDMMASRQAQEVQIAMLVAKKFPRDQVAAYNNILRECQRVRLAEKAMYEYPRGNERITGPSIKLAEVVARYWGNIDANFTLLERKNGVSQVMAYAWDLETNTRWSRTFSVPHIRHTKKGDYVLTNDRDISEMEANQAARRIRSCIFNVIPGDVVEAAIEQCAKTLREGYKEPLIDRIRTMARVFEEEFSVTLPMIEKFIGYKYSAFTENDFVRLKRVYVSLRDNMAKREDYFEIALPVNESEISDPFNSGNNVAEKKEGAVDGTESK